MDGRLEGQGLRPKAQEALADSELDQEIASAVGIEPSPEFLARVRTRIATDPGLVVESGFSRMRHLSFEPLWGVAIAGIVLAVVVPQFMREDAVAPTVHRGVARSRVELPVVTAPVGPVVAVRPDVQVGPPPMASTRIQTRGVVHDRAESPRTLPLQLSPVLFAEEDQRAFAVFVAAVGEGRVPEEVVKRSRESSGETALSIEPLVITPLPPLARATYEGEGQWE
jgi:hypothetical protein